MDTVTAPSEIRPAYGSIEYFAARIRTRVTTRQDLVDNLHEMYAMCYIESAAENATLTGDQLRERLRTILAARDRVAEGIRAAGR